jgi:hypothetical protein
MLTSSHYITPVVNESVNILVHTEMINEEDSENEWYYPGCS